MTKFNEKMTEVGTAISDAVASIPATIKQNRVELVRGSVVDPFNHPSRSPARVAQITNNHAAYAKGVAALKVQYDIP